MSASARGGLHSMAAYYIGVGLGMLAALHVTRPRPNTALPGPIGVNVFRVCDDPSCSYCPPVGTSPIDLDALRAYVAERDYPSPPIALPGQLHPTIDPSEQQL